MWASSTHWATPEVTEDGRYISGHHRLLHITGADCPCNGYGDPEFVPEVREATIRCAHCGERHYTVAQVADCSGVFVDERTCEHGLALVLCADPDTHYPRDERP